MLLLKGFGAVGLVIGAAACAPSDSYVIGHESAAPALDGGPDATGGTDSGPPGQGGAGGGDACGSLPAPQLGACPPQCTDGCNGNICRIHCTETAPCSSAGSVECPEGWPCTVRCVGDQVCKNVYVLCPDGHGCDVTCTGTQACQGAVIQCGATGTCSLTCADHQACDDADVYCGGGDCAATCAPQPAGDHPALHCAAGGCACTDC